MLWDLSCWLIFTLRWTKHFEILAKLLIPSALLNNPPPHSHTVMGDFKADLFLYLDSTLEPPRKLEYLRNISAGQLVK